jgi:hypothetical protein
MSLLFFTGLFSGAAAPFESQHTLLTTSTTAASSSTGPTSPSPGDIPTSSTVVTNSSGSWYRYQNIELGFVPFHLRHLLRDKEGGGEQCFFLLSGSDNKIHLYQQQQQQPAQV